MDLAIPPVIVALVRQKDGLALLSKATGLSAEEVQGRLVEFPEPVACPGKLPLADETRELMALAREFAQEVPDPAHGGAIAARHLACALAAVPQARVHFKIEPLARVKALALLAAWYQEDLPSVRLDQLSVSRAAMQAALFAKVFGQDHAVLAFVEGLYNAEVLAAADTERRAPRGVFVFAGPPGVGKTLLAETGAIHLERPFKRFDMTSYATWIQAEGLAGDPPMYRGARPGALTGFVEHNPNAVLLFDEIEKAHPVVIQLFLQVLDAGVLEDKFTERNVVFRDTTVIFTTNAGRKLYDRADGTGVLAANDAFHRQTIMDALEHEQHPHSRDAVFPPALLSRMATGYPVLFNHLKVNELERVVTAEFKRVAALFERQYEKALQFDDLLALALVLREGTRSDARVVRAQAEIFVKREIFAVCDLYQKERLEQVLEQVDRIRFGVDRAARESDASIRALFEASEKPVVLLVADEALGALYREHLPELAWHVVSQPEDALEILSTIDVRVVLVDIWLGRVTLPGAPTALEFDHVPLASSSLDRGQEILHRIRSRLPETPVYLLSLSTRAQERETFSIATELYMACVRGGGARGLVESRFVDAAGDGWQARRDALKADLARLCRDLYREAMAEQLGRERKVLAFDIEQRVGEPREITLSLRHLRLAHAMKSTDVGEVLSDIERPTTLFADVIGSEPAKEELRFFIDYLKNPRRYAAMGLKPPRGVLLHGPPGTGKTMLARAMAGESNVAFIPAVATNFVTIWQGSGPQSVRDLFARARRYAPAIIFIDELDAIGLARGGAIGAGRAQENTLNALLAEMDGFTSPSANRPIFLLAATNFPIRGAANGGGKVLDPALVRRFSRTILVDLPEKAARAQYLEKRLRARAGATVDDATIQLVALRAAGMSIANLELIIETAARETVRTGAPLSNEVFLEAFEKSLHGEASEQTPATREKVARHEAGHTVMFWLGGWWPSYVTTVSRGDHGGYTGASTQQLDGVSDYTRAQLLALVRVYLGGRAAELAYYGPDEGLNTGAASDLEQASHVVRMMLCRYGMDESGELFTTPSLVHSEAALASPLYQKLEAAAQVILKREMAGTIALLETHRAALDRLSAALLEKERLTTEDVKRILGEPPR